MGESTPTSADGAINRGAIAFREGRTADARAMFARALNLDPDKEIAWLWFATVTRDVAEQRYCLNRALQINPESTGLRRLAVLPPGDSRVPPELTELGEPPLPPDLVGSIYDPLPVLPRTVVERRHRAQASRPARIRRREEEKPVAGEAPPARPSPWWQRGRVLAVVCLVGLALALAATWWFNPGGAERDYVIAYAGPLTGPTASNGQEQLAAITLAVNETNAAGGINGRLVHVLSFDDQNDPARGAAVAAQIVAHPEILLVIGHDNSDVSLAAAPIYEKAGIVAISPSSTIDSLTAADPWYFRTVFTNSTEGAYLSGYLQHALGVNRASTIATTGVYESTLAEAFAADFARDGAIAHQWTIDPDDRDDSIAKIVTELKATNDPGFLFLALEPEDAKPLVLAIRRAGITAPMFGGEALGFASFARSFADEPEEAGDVGYFTNQMMVAAPLIYDSLGSNALDFANRFLAVNGYKPEWYGARAYDAATIALHALQGMSDAEIPHGEYQAERDKIRQVMTGMDSITSSIPGLTGPLYFDGRHNTPQVLSIGLFDRRVLSSAPTQFRIITEPEQFDIAADKAAGRVFQMGDLLLREYRVAFVGVDINTITNINQTAQTFTADFFLWFRYTGDDNALNIFFTNSTTPNTSMPAPLETSTVNGQKFVMYRITATFNQPMNFQDYPWDEHDLTIGLQNVRLPWDDLVYAPDASILSEPQAIRLRSAVDFDAPFNQVPSWVATSVMFVQDFATSRSTTPDPATGAPEYTQMSTFQVDMNYERDIRPFLIKNLLPLALLALVTYISLYFSPETASTRIGFSITAILTTSVMLQSLANSLPDVGYTVAIEWGYYAYILLAAVTVLINITIDRWYKRKRYAAVGQLDLFVRVLYPLVLIGVLAAYIYHYGPG